MRPHLSQEALSRSMTLPRPMTAITSRLSRFCRRLRPAVLGGGTTTYTISGTIAPTSGGAQATVSLTGAATAAVTADSSGNYSFSGLANGSYTVTPGKSGYTFTPASLSETVSGSNLTGQNFTATAVVPQTYSISGTLSPASVAAGSLVLSAVPRTRPRQLMRQATTASRVCKADLTE